MRQLVRNLIRVVAPDRPDRPDRPDQQVRAETAAYARLAKPGADKAFLVRYRDTLAVFEIALVRADIPAMDAAAAKLTRMQDDLAALGGAPGRFPGDGA